MNVLCLYIYFYCIFLIPSNGGTPAYRRLRWPCAGAWRRLAGVRCSTFLFMIFEIGSSLDFEFFLFWFPGFRQKFPANFHPSKKFRPAFFRLLFLPTQNFTPQFLLYFLSRAAGSGGYFYFIFCRGRCRVLLLFVAVAAQFYYIFCRGRCLVLLLFVAVAAQFYYFSFWFYIYLSGFYFGFIFIYLVFVLVYIYLFSFYFGYLFIILYFLFFLLRRTVALTHAAACVGFERWAWRRLALSALFHALFISKTPTIFLLGYFLV